MGAAVQMEALLAPISDDQPCGPNLEYDPEMLALEDAARGKVEQQFGDTIVPAEEPDWRDVRARSLVVLGRTRDLRAAAHLLRAAVKLDGWVGAASGFRLIQDLLDRWWDGVHPQLDEEDGGDPTFRINALLSIADPGTMLNDLRALPLAEAPGLGGASLADVQRVATGSGDGSAVDAIFAGAPSDAIEATVAALAEAEAAVAGITKVLTDRDMPTRSGGLTGPDLAALHKLLKDARLAIAAQRGDTAAEAIAGDVLDASSAGTSPASAAVGVGAIASRGDVVRALDAIMRFYSRAEPASPIPLLLQRARRLVDADFLAVMRDIAPDALPQVLQVTGASENPS